jgi:hypothetical protein
MIDITFYFHDRASDEARTIIISSAAVPREGEFVRIYHEDVLAVSGFVESVAWVYTDRVTATIFLDYQKRLTH